MSTATTTGTQTSIPQDPDAHDVIRVQGARANNLQDVSVEIPKRRLTVFTGVSGSGKSSLVFDTVAAKVGWSERQLVAAAREHRVIHTHPASHATYYPGAQGMSMKLLVDPASDAILGAQIVGGEGVDKRIDVIAVAMAGGITASGLARLELAYAPQFGSAKDPVNLLGYMAENVLSGDCDVVDPVELDGLVAGGWALVDVRTTEEHERGAIPGSTNIPVDELRPRLEELRGAPVVVYCEVGQRGHTATALLMESGIRARNLDGGFQTWQAAMRARGLEAQLQPTA